MASIIWFVTLVLFVIFIVLFLIRVVKKRKAVKDMIDDVDRQVFNFKEFLKMAFPAACIYAVLYFVFVILCRFQVFGEIEKMNASTWIPSLFALYFAIWFLLHVIDMDCRSRNEPFAFFLRTINTNTGVRNWNFILLGFSLFILIASIITTLANQGRVFYLCGPLFFAITLSTFINLFVGDNSDWNVKSPSKIKWRPNDCDSPEKVKVKAASQDGDDKNQKTVPNPNNKTPIKKTFKWNLKEKWGISESPEDKVEITLFKEDWEDPDEDMRKKNPFYGQDAGGNMNWPVAQMSLDNSARIIIQGPDANGEQSETIALDTIVNDAFDVADKYNLADYEVPELLLTLVQNEIRYVLDKDSKSICMFSIEDNLEYFRFASETLYDGEGDCDCKAVLACRLLKALGMDAKLISVCDKGQTQPNHAAVLFKDDFNRFKKCTDPRYSSYTYCEATGNGWHIGEISQEIDETSFKVLA